MKSAERFGEQHELEGVIDTHIHIAPEIRPRRLDAVDLAIEAYNAGIKAFVIKPFLFLSIERAYFAQKAVPRIKVFGGLTLSRQCNGLNIFAVDAAIKMGAKEIWLPAVDSVLMAAKEAPKRAPFYYGRGYMIPKQKEAIAVVKNGKIVSELEGILHRIAEANEVILGTSHTSSEDSLIVIDEAKSVGVEKILVTHPNNPVIGATIEQQKEMVKKGAYMEYVFVTTYGIYGGQDPAEIAEMIKAVGPQKSIMATDMGQPLVPSPVEGMRMFIRSMRLHGISQNDIDVMTKENPRKLLGL